MKEVLLVAAGGAGGALTRYLIHLAFAQIRASGVIATLAVNISGSFALGFLLSLALSRATFSGGIQLLIGIGFLSSYTTFSTVMWDTFYLGQNGTLPLAVLNMGVTLLAGLAAVTAGFYVGRLV